MAIDWTCSMHGKLASEHLCLYCCLCFEDLAPDDCWVDGDGQKWDMCETCGNRNGEDSKSSESTSASP